MNNILVGYSYSNLMSILGPLFVCIIIIVLIVVIGKSKQIQSSKINQESFEALAQELKADNEILKSELAAIKETVNSINKMMKEIE